MLDHTVRIVQDGHLDWANRSGGRGVLNGDRFCKVVDFNVSIFVRARITAEIKG